MGQCLSSPKPSIDVQAFTNLPKEAIEGLWTSYNLLGEGWGLNESEVIAIFHGTPFITGNIPFSDDQLKKLFKAFDTDHNGLIDALEMCVALALVSGEFVTYNALKIKAFLDDNNNLHIFHPFFI